MEAKYVECPYSHSRIGSIRGHLTYVHNRTKAKKHTAHTSKRCADMEKMKRHIFQKECKIINIKTGIAKWNDIAMGNLKEN